MRSLIIICLFAMAIAGCSTKPEAIVRPVGSERYQVAEAALRHVMDEFSTSGEERKVCSAYVIDSGEFTSKLVVAFSNYTPKVVANIRISTNGTFTDAMTGKAVRLWSVDAVEIHGDRAIANVSCAASGLDGVGFTVNLRHKDGKWVFESETVNAVS